MVTVASIEDLWGWLLTTSYRGFGLLRASSLGFRLQKMALLILHLLLIGFGNKL